ncbi:MAG: 1-deoxy-D-xylulose-5-phosphate synthase [Bacillota bacterium]|nr:1-deoxy-D-xylulose-5-phosphate synthase [Bacillota bacterium]
MSGFLEKINEPADLKQMKLKELEQLAAEIRNLMIDVISKRGGHLASSLGVVELTIALHYAFNAPTDKIIWDVGHQCYAHKILTGRREQFESIRCYQGISGFPKIDESPYDAFSVGHSSTSLSAALGIAQARDLRNEKSFVVDVIGDGALTGGMAFEALNYAGEIKPDLIVILNDNEMSIDQNVGGLPSYLAKLRTDPKYFRLKEDLEQVLERIPAIGRTMLRSAERLKDSVKYLLVPGMLFEELGFTYLGPIDGHSLVKLLELLRHAKSMKGPVLIHVVTKKGKGYTPAEKDPNRFHGVGPFNKETGKPLHNASTNPTYSEVFGTTLEKLASEDDSIVAITAAMASGTGLDGFSKRWPKRFFDVGIAEQNAVTMASGLAVEGFNPVVAIYSTFLQRAYDQILHDVCLQNQHVVLCIDRAGIVGEDGETHNGLFDYSYLRHMPGLVLMSPASGAELSSMLKTALSLKSPVAIRYPRGRTEAPSPAELKEIILVGKGKLLKEGGDILILAAGSMVLPALEAYEILLEKGIHSCIINPRFIKPLDRELISHWAFKCKRVLTVEDHILQGGFGSAVLEMFEEEGIEGVCLKRMGFRHPFTGQGSRDYILDLHGLSGKGIAKEAVLLCQVGEKVG